MLGDNRSGKGYIDLAGKFPFVSNRGHQYILVAYNYDANHISAMPIKNRESASIERAWKVLNAETYVIDNEASASLKDVMQMKNRKYQLVPPHNHRANSAERAIQTFKEHFKTILATADPKFSIGL